MAPFEAINGQQAFEFLLSLLLASLLILSNQLRAFKLADSIAQDDILEFKLLSFFLPSCDLGDIILMLRRQ